MKGHDSDSIAQYHLQICVMTHHIVPICHSTVQGDYRPHRSWDMAISGRPPGLLTSGNRSPKPKPDRLGRPGDRNFQHWPEIWFSGDCLFKNKLLLKVGAYIMTTPFWKVSVHCYFPGNMLFKIACKIDSIVPNTFHSSANAWNA